MRLFFTGPRIMGIRPGISFDAASLIGGASRQRKTGAPANASFVYVVRGDHQMVKVGVTSNPDARIAQLRTGSGFPIEYAWLGVTSSTGYDIEQTAHRILARHRVHGEWFDCMPDIAVAAIAAASYRVGQPIAPIPPERAAEILRAAVQQAPPTWAENGPLSLPVKISILAGVTTTIVLFIAIILKG